MRRASRPGVERDAGFSLVEVIVSLVLLGIVATAALYFFIEGTRTTSHLQRTQNAVAVANEAMERAYAVEPRDSLAVPGTPTIVVGRTQASVEAAWATAAALGLEGVADTYPIWDSTATASSTPVLPVTYTRYHSTQTYAVSILVGTCFRDSDDLTTNQVCTRLPGVTADPGDAGTPAGKVRMLRILAIVTWQPLAGECTVGTCSYQLSGLMDRSDDLEWNQVFTPVAVDDYASFVQGESRGINVMANDLIGPLRSGPVTILSGPASGQGTVTVSTNGTITYTAPANASGIFTFTYRLKDARGAVSGPGTVYITLPPQSADDTARVLFGGTTPIAVTGNDIGSPVSLTIVGGPNHGSASVSGLNISYTPSINSGTDSIGYTYKDGSGQVSPQATLTILIDSLTTQDRLIELPARVAPTDEWTALRDTLIAGNNNLGDIRIAIVGPAPSAGTVRVDGVAYTKTGAGDFSSAGTNIDYSPPLNTIGEFGFGYVLTRVSSGSTSAPKTMIVRMLPVATADTIPGRLATDGTREIQVGSNDRPTVFGGSTNVTVVLGAMSTGTCGATFPASQKRLTAGVIQVVTPGNGDANCSFQYTLVGAGSLSGLRSGPVTVSFSY